MNFFDRAIKNITRNIPKTVLLLLAFFMIGNFVIVGLSVANASETAKILTRKKMTAVAKYEINYDQFYRDAENIEDDDEREEFFQNMPKITFKDVKNVLSDSRVKTANVNNTNMVYAIEGETDFVHLNNDMENQSENGQSCYIDETGTEMCQTYKEPSFVVKGNFFPDMIEFEIGDFTMTSGRFYTAEEIDNRAKVCVITDALANENGLSIGDTIRFAYENYGEWLSRFNLDEDDFVMELEVIGTYDHIHHVTPDSSNYNWISPYSNPDNTILMPATTLFEKQVLIDQAYFDYYSELYPDEEYYKNPDNRISLDNMDNIDLYDVTILLNDPLEVDDFAKERNVELGASYKKITVDNKEFKKLSKPLDTLNDYANFIVWLVVCNAVVIITLVTALTLRNREYEIGVLLSVGASKFKVIAQFFIELAIVALLGFTLAVGSGSVVSKQIGASLLENQIESSGVTEEEDEYWVGGDYYDPWNSDYSTDISLDDILSEYQVTVSPLIIAEIYVVGLGIVLVSVIIPSIMIMRFNPKKILMNQR